MQTNRAMTTKEQILQALDQLPEPLLVRVLEFTRTLEAEAKPDETDIDREVWQAYLATEQEWEEVYRRLADS